MVWKATTREMNTTIPTELVAEALADDPERGGAEWMGEFRRDIAAFVSADVIAAAVIPGRYELPRVPGVRYHGFLDPSGGSADSFTLAVAHGEGNRAVLDLVREVGPPFSPEAVCADFAAVLQGYGVNRATADGYAGVWVAEAFGRQGVIVDQCAKAKSDLYGELLPGLNSGRVELLDHPRLSGQLASLERRTARSGKDNIDHGPGAHDDLANAAAGALTMALVRPVAQIKASDFIIGTPLESSTMFGPMADWRTAFKEYSLRTGDTPLRLSAVHPLACCGLRRSHAPAQAGQLLPRAPHELPPRLPIALPSGHDPCQPEFAGSNPAVTGNTRYRAARYALPGRLLPRWIARASPSARRLRPEPSTLLIELIGKVANGIGQLSQPRPLVSRPFGDGGPRLVQDLDNGTISVERLRISRPGTTIPLGRRHQSAKRGAKRSTIAIKMGIMIPFCDPQVFSGLPESKRQVAFDPLDPVQALGLDPGFGFKQQPANRERMLADRIHS